MSSVPCIKSPSFSIPAPRTSFHPQLTWKPMPLFRHSHKPVRGPLYTPKRLRGLFCFKAIENSVQQRKINTTQESLLPLLHCSIDASPTARPAFPCGPRLARTDRPCHPSLPAFHCPVGQRRFALLDRNRRRPR